MRFESFHPALAFFWFAAVIGCTIAFHHPVFLALSYLCALFYAIRLSQKRAIRLAVVLWGLAALYVLWYALNEHFGVTPLFRLPSGNRVTLEAILRGAMVAVTVSAAALWLFCMHKVITADKVVYLFGRISPRLSLFLAVIFRMTPHLRGQFSRITAARRGIGLAPAQGSVWARIKNFFAAVSMTVTWLIDALVTASDSMRSRGYTLKGRTAFPLRRFGKYDLLLSLVLAALLAVTLLGAITGETAALFDPALSIRPLTLRTVLFSAAYALLCLLPILTKICQENRPLDINMPGGRFS